MPGGTFSEFSVTLVDSGDDLRMFLMRGPLPIGLAEGRPWQEIEGIGDSPHGVRQIAIVSGLTQRSVELLIEIGKLIDVIPLDHGDLAFNDLVQEINVRNVGAVSRECRSRPFQNFAQCVQLQNLLPVQIGDHNAAGRHLR
jgi:hypothetical protein